MRRNAYASLLSFFVLNGITALSLAIVSFFMSGTSADMLIMYNGSFLQLYFLYFVSVSFFMMHGFFLIELFDLHLTKIKKIVFYTTWYGIKSFTIATAFAVNAKVLEWSTIQYIGYVSFVIGSMIALEILNINALSTYRKTGKHTHFGMWIYHERLTNHLSGNKEVNEK